MFLLCYLMGCSRADYVNRITFDDGCWDIQDTLRAQMPASQDEEIRLRIDVQLGAEYGYDNLYLKLQYRSPSGKVQETLLNNTLLTPSGEWLTERQGDRVRWTFAPAPSLPGDETGQYEIALWHYMRDTELCEVYAVGIGVMDEGEGRSKN